MNLDEAIRHADERSGIDSPCSVEHEQLADWLRELRKRRSNSDTTISGLCANHCVVTDVCRTNRGDEGAIEETMRRTRKTLEGVISGWARGSGAKFHVVVTVERPT